MKHSSPIPHPANIAALARIDREMQRETDPEKLEQLRLRRWLANGGTREGYKEFNKNTTDASTS